jgi:hypothetical protein
MGDLSVVFTSKFRRLTMSVRDKVHLALAKIGTSNGTKLPEEASNTDPLLHELYIASEIKSHADKRHKLAKAAVEESGLFNPDDVAIGSTQQVVDGTVYALNLQVKNPVSKVDSKKFKTALTLAGVSQEIIDKAEADATTQNAPAKVYTVATK